MHRGGRAFDEKLAPVEGMYELLHEQFASLLACSCAEVCHITEWQSSTV